MNILAYFVQSQVILLVFYLLYIRILHRKINFGLSRVYLLIIAPVSFILPLINISIGTESYQSFSSYLPEILITADEKPQIGNSLENLTIYILSIVYIIGVVCTLYKLFSYIRQSLKILKLSEKTTINGKEVIISPNQTGAFSVLGRIIIGEYSLNNAGISHIIRHEELHCRLFHSFDIILMSIQKAILWFNPIIRHLEKLLREVHEFEVDDHIIKFGVSPIEYSNLLLNFEMGLEEPVIANRFSYLSLKDRILMMANVQKAKSNMRILLILPIILCFIVLFCIAPVGCSNSDIGNLDVIKKEETKEMSFATCYIKPMFNGGDQREFTKWIFEQIRYPEIAKKNGIQGKVTLQFTINEYGKICDIKVIRGVDEFLDKEALRVVSLSPDWTPGKDDKGSPVKVRFTFPVIFQLR